MESLVKWLKRHQKPMSRKISNLKMVEKRRKEGRVIIGYFGPLKKNRNFGIFLDVALSMSKSDLVFVHSRDTSLSDEQSIVLFRNFGDGNVIFDQKISAGVLKEWIQANRY